MTIDRTYPIFTVCLLAVHGLTVPTVSFLGSISAIMVEAIPNRKRMLSKRISSNCSKT